MNKIKLSLVAVALLATQNISADSTSLEDAFKNGSFSGDITLYGEQVNKSGSNADSGFTMGSIGLGYETDTFNGFKGVVAFRTNHDFNEKEDGDYSDGTDPKSILSTANISYQNDMLGLTLGRQEIDLEWIGDFHEAAVGTLTIIPDTTLIVGHTNRSTAVDPDAALADFEKVNGDNGATLAHVVYEGIKDLAVEGYFYKAKELANWYGAKINYDNDQFGITAHHAKSSEKVAATEDGNITHFELRTSLADVALNGGYITTDKTGNVGSMSTLGDNINPLEEGNQVYGTDADTFYLGLGYEIGALSLGAIYGKTDYETSSDETELNFTAEYAMDENTIGSLVIADIDANNTDDDYTKIALTLSYTF